MLLWSVQSIPRDPRLWRHWHEVDTSGTKRHDAGVLTGLPALLTVEEVAQVLRVSKRSAYRLLSEEPAANRIRAIRIGRLLRVERSELERYLTGGSVAQGTFPWT
jgi:excisionase family DNA binding protein